MKNKTKIFCIGFHKTGTTSLTEALKILGYKVTGPNGVWDPNISRNVYSITNKLIKKYDAFQDNPWPIIYKELDKKYPNSKFILTIRDPEDWIKSQVKHFGYEDSPMRKWIYGVGHPKGNEKIYLNRYKNHNQEVIDYFKNRPEDFLILDFSKGDGWEKLCSFLNKDIPNIPFPHTNKASDRQLKEQKKSIKKVLSHIKRKIKYKSS